MQRRELIRRLIADESVERCGFWLGNPDPKTWPILHRYFGTTSDVVQHSCGSVYRVIERLIAAGVDCLHPLQAQARDRNAERLAADFRGRLTFIGGIDVQSLLTYGTPEQIRHDVRRVKSLLGPNLIVSPSHDAILPNVPPENVAALAEAAREGARG